MTNLISKIKNLRTYNNLPVYAENIMKAVERVISTGRTEELGANSVLFINRMWSNRN